MKIKPLLFFTFLLIFQFTFAQSDTFTDLRDGNIYPIVKVGNTKWFQENLRYETAHSHCPNFNKKAIDCEYGNFYKYQERDTICPKGWQVASMEDWENYIFLMEQKKGGALRKDVFKEGPNSVTMLDDTTGLIQLFDDKDPLQLSDIGWVQGKRRQKTGTVTYWVLDEDKRFHTHIGNNAYVKHAHDHHINDKRKKNRKFAVRCVCKEATD